MGNGHSFCLILTSILSHSTLLEKGLWAHETWKGEKIVSYHGWNIPELICEAVIGNAGNRETPKTEYENETGKQKTEEMSGHVIWIYFINKMLCYNDIFLKKYRQKKMAK